MFRIRTAVLLGCAASAVALPVSAQTTLDTRVGNPIYYSFALGNGEGADNLAQVYLTGGSATMLSSFSFFLDGAGNSDLVKAQVWASDGTNETGAVLWESALVAAPVSGNDVEYAFASNLMLNANSYYLIQLVNTGSYVVQNYVGGAGVPDWSDYGNLTHGSVAFGFHLHQDLDVMMTMTFDDPGTTVTPEPISMALVGTGLAGISAARRRRREAAKSN